MEYLPNSLQNSLFGLESSTAPQGPTDLLETRAPKRPETK